MRLQTCGRWAAEQTVGNPRWGVLSLRCHGDPPPALHEFWGFVRMVTVDDDDRPPAEAVTQIVTAVCKARDEGYEGLLIHCAMGVSRSVGVARAIAAAWGLRYESPHYGNWALRRAVYEALAQRQRVGATRGTP